MSFNITCTDPNKFKVEEYVSHPAFELELTIANPNTQVTLPLLRTYNSGVSFYQYNFTVNYGDGTDLKTITAYNDPDGIHTYVNPGTYRLKISGLCENFHIKDAYYDNTAFGLLITRIIHWGQTKFININFTECFNLKSINKPEAGCFALIQDFKRVFYLCIGLQVIPDGLFDSAVSATSFEDTFLDCINLLAIPVGLFDENILVTNFKGTFRGCVSLSVIPNNLFRYNPLVTTFEQTFYSNVNQPSGITVIPDDLFRYNPNVITFKETFFFSDIPAIPAGLFRYNPLVTSFYATFWGCTKLLQIPVGLFRYNTAVTTFYGVFVDCLLLTTIPADLFRYNVLATNFDRCFETCIALATIPADLLRYNVLATTFDRLFMDLPITVIPVDLFRYNVAALNFKQVFYNCVYIATIPAGIFSYNTLVTSYESAFQMQIPKVFAGNAPALWSLVPEPTGTNCFTNCTGFTNYAAIPNDWKGL